MLRWLVGAECPGVANESIERGNSTGNESATQRESKYDAVTKHFSASPQKFSLSHRVMTGNARCRILIEQLAVVIGLRTLTPCGATPASTDASLV